MQYGGDDHQQLSRVLAGFAKHANIAAYLVIGLGCETGQASFLVDNYGLTQLQIPGRKPDEQSVRAKLAARDEHSRRRRRAERRSTGRWACSRKCCRKSTASSACRFPSAEIILGTNCGGSDGNSGVTANPALGYASDLLVAHGANVDPGRDARDLRRRAPPDAARRLPARWAKRSSA